MKTAILASKLSIPKPPPLAIERKRLVRRIMQENDADLILLTAPAGHGKTTLAGQILASVPASNRGWYHLDEHDLHPERFLAHLTAAIGPLLPQSMSESFFEDSNPDDESVRQRMDGICFALESYRGPRFWLVLDNWECVNKNRLISEMPLALIRSGSGRLRIIITSRVRPGFKIRREQARGTVMTLGSGDLAFTLPECQEAMNVRFGADIPAETAEEFWRKTSGWCVALGLLSGPRHVASFASIGSLGGKASDDVALDDYFREELFDNLVPELTEFLRETSLFDLLTPDRCTAITGDKKKTEINLRQLEHSALPFTALENKAQFRLHPLVRQSLKSLLRRSASSDRLSFLYRAAADQYLQEGMALEAVELFVENADHDSALEIMNTKWSEILGKHGWERVRQLLEQIPDSHHNRSAYIKTYSNVLNVSGDNKGSIAFLKNKLSPERFRDDIESFGSLWANYWWARINTEPGPYYDPVREAHDRLVSSEEGFSLTMLAIFQNTLAMAAHLDLRATQAIGHIEKALELVEEPYVRLKVIANQNLALYSHMLGRSEKALEILSQVRDDCHRLELETQIPKAYMVQANIHLGMGRYRETIVDVERCIEAMRESGSYSLLFDAYVNRFRGLALWHLGDHNEGLRLLESSREPAEQYNYLSGIEVELLCEYYSLLDGRRLRTSRRYENPDRNAVSESRLISTALEGVKAFMKRDLTRLRRHAHQIYKIAEQHKLAPWLVTGSFLMALSLDRSKNNRDQTDLLEAGLRQLYEIGWRAYPMANDIITSYVIARSARLNIDWKYIDLLLSDERDIDLTPAFDAEMKDRNLTGEERTRLWNAATRLSVRGLSGRLKSRFADEDDEEKSAKTRYREFLDNSIMPPLQFRLLGEFSVISQGRIVHFSRASSRRLLQYLLVHYPGIVHEEELIEYLWPECEPAKGRLNLHTAVKDLRKALDLYAEPRGKSYILYGEQHYRLELPHGSRIDFMEFIAHAEHCLNRGTSAESSGAESVLAFRETLGAYRGILLPMLPYESFTIELRERLQTLFRRVSLQFGELLNSLRRFEESASVIERVLVDDPLWTEGVLVLLRAYVDQGEILKAMRAYKNYEKKLQDDLSLAPDEGVREYLENTIRSSM